MVSVFVYIIMEGMRNIFVNMKGDGCMNETLQQYMMLVKEHYDTINGPDYTGKEEDIEKRKSKSSFTPKRSSKAFQQMTTMMNSQMP